MPVTIQGIRSTATSIQIAQGGTGRTSLDSGSLLVGNGSEAVGLIAPGTNGQVLTVVDGVWTAANASGGGGGGGLSTVNTSGNVQGDGSAGSPVALKANISLTSVTASFSGSGAALSNIPNAALQNSSITINGQAVSLGDSTTIQTGPSAISSSGNLTGSGVDGNAITLKDNISLTSVTASFSGNGAAITGLQSSQLSDFNSSVDARITNIPNAALQNSSITINGSPISLGGSVTVADTSTMTFTGSGFSVGNIVAMSGALVLADYSDSMKSNAIGAVTAVSGTSVTVRVFGEVTATSASLVSAVGTPMYVGPSGSVVQYSGITSGKYITQVGYITPSSGKIVLQPRVFGQLA